MVLALHYKKNEKTVYIKLADIVTEEQGLVFLHSLDYEELSEASLCKDNGIIIYRISI